MTTSRRKKPTGRYGATNTRSRMKAAAMEATGDSSPTTASERLSELFLGLKCFIQFKKSTLSVSQFYIEVNTISEREAPSVDALFHMVANSNPNRTDASLYGIVAKGATDSVKSPPPSIDIEAPGRSEDRPSAASVTDSRTDTAPTVAEKRKRGRPRKEGIGGPIEPAAKRPKAVVDRSVHEIRITLSSLRLLLAEYSRRLRSGQPVDFEELRTAIGERMEPWDLSAIDLEYIVTEFTAIKYRPSLGLVLMERPGAFQPSNRAVNRAGISEVGARLKELWKEHRTNTPLTGENVAADRIRANGAVRWLRGCTTASTLSSTAWDFWASSTAVAPSPIRPSGITRLASLSAAVMGDLSPYGSEGGQRFSTGMVSPVVGGGIFEPIF
ncbi:hypothetical protein FOL47_010607 [Perkinsus chesapeaki]|uniref:Uncharacterized protein n=1 Tax=Perkinsus chesapeaki TaxID=330153 RepID=A0A7J6L290_PERCH|nr:hypothetical protein FOL47_010607 [Perkinsus chesapeaki]